MGSDPIDHLNISTDKPAKAMMAWIATTAIAGGLFFSRKAKTIPPPTSASTNSSAAMLFALSIGP